MKASEIIKILKEQNWYLEELLEYAQDALSLILEEYLQKNNEMPEPSIIDGENIVYVEPYPEVLLSIEIRNIRKEIGASQTEIASKMNIPYQTYQRWEHSKNFNPTLKTLRKVAKALNKKLEIKFI
ncbi:MAG: helix-turn-helix transcriptional regulator [Candidatus Omnitrophota bacterium]